MCLLTEYGILRNLFLDTFSTYIVHTYMMCVCVLPTNFFYKVGQKVNYDVTSEFKLGRKEGSPEES